MASASLDPRPPVRSEGGSEWSAAAAYVVFARRRRQLAQWNGRCWRLLHSPQSRYPRPTHGLEFLIVAGGMTNHGERLEPQSWGRLPAGESLEAMTGPEGAQIWIKDAPLQHPDVLQMPA